MEKEFEDLIETLKQFEGVTVLATSLEHGWIHFAANQSGLSHITNQLKEIKEQHSWGLISLPGNAEETTYQLIIETSDKLGAVLALTKRLANILAANGDERKAKNTELGLPDLSLVTIRQMATELKQRQNLTFALVWIENNERDNIAIEGSGNPTQLIGLLARGSHMAIEWADKNIKFYKPGQD